MMYEGGAGKTKCQKFLEGRKNEKVEHNPKSITLVLDNGNRFTITAFAKGWEIESYGLNFEFEEKSQISHLFRLGPNLRHYPPAILKKAIEKFNKIKR